MTTGSASVALVMSTGVSASTPAMVTVAIPAVAATVKLPVTVSPVASVTLLSSVPLMPVMTGAASVEPVTVMVSVVRETSPSASVMP